MAAEAATRRPSLVWATNGTLIACPPLALCTWRLSRSDVRVRAAGLLVPPGVDLISFILLLCLSPTEAVATGVGNDSRLTDSWANNYRAIPVLRQPFFAGVVPHLGIGMLNRELVPTCSYQ